MPLLPVPIDAHTMRRLAEKLVPPVKAYVAKLARAGDEAWQVERDRIYREWLEDFAVLTQEQFDFLWPRVADLETTLAALLEDAAAQRVHANYANAAANEAIPERRRMLAYADAALIDAELTIAQHARVERLLRELDPSDVLWLAVLDRVAGNTFRGSQLRSEAHVRWSMWSECPAADILISSACVRIQHTSGGAGLPGWDGAVITREGRQVLRVMRLYVRASGLPIVPAGREARPGDVSADEAWARIDAFPGLREDVIRLAATGVAFYYPPHADDAGPPPHNAEGILRISSVGTAAAEAFVRGKPIAEHVMLTQASKAPLVDEIRFASRNWDPSTGALVEINGPHDVLRWLADEVDARWT